MGEKCGIRRNPPSLKITRRSTGLQPPRGLLVELYLCTVTDFLDEFSIIYDQRIALSDKFVYVQSHVLQEDKQLVLSISGRVDFSV